VEVLRLVSVNRLDKRLFTLFIGNVDAHNKVWYTFDTNINTREHTEHVWYSYRGDVVHIWYRYKHCVDVF